MADIDFIKQIHIAQFWRQHLGEYEYVNHNADDLLRWFVALETRGPDEIRDYLVERTGRHPRGPVTGITSAPHPPLDIIDIWLTSHNKRSNAPYWLGLVVFGVVSFLLAVNLQSCVNLRDPNWLANNPRESQSLQRGNFSQPPAQAGSTLPNPGPAPANTASPPATAPHH